MLVTTKWKYLNISFQLSLIGYAGSNFARSTLVYSVDDNSWGYANSGFPVSSEHGITVPYGNGFLLIDGNGAEETIYRYDTLVV